MEPADRPPSWLADSLRAHALQFETPVAQAYGNAAGTRMLWAFLAVGIGAVLAARLLFHAAGPRGSPAANLAFVLALLAAFVAVQRKFIAIPFSQVGLRRYPDWTRRERRYFLQVIPLAAVAFAVVFRAHLEALRELHGLAGFLVFSILTGLIWGMVQEFIYRGWLQTELTRRFGAVAGVLGANAVFTFGPLHFAGAGAVDWSVLVAVFGIGIFFGIVYHRSGNLWIPALMHGLWPPNMT